MLWLKIAISNGPITRLILGSVVRRSLQDAIIVTQRRRTISANGTVERGVLTHHANEHRRRIGKSHGAGREKREKLGERRVSSAPRLADVFDNKAPHGARDDLFELIRNTP